MRIYAFERPYHPVIFRRGTVVQEIYACQSLAVAEEFFEAIDVADDEFVFFGDDGTVISASVTDDSRVVLTPTGERRPDELRQRLRSYLTQPRVGLDPALADDPAMLAELLIERQRAQRWPRWPGRRNRTTST